MSGCCVGDKQSDTQKNTHTYIAIIDSNGQEAGLTMFFLCSLVSHHTLIRSLIEGLNIFKEHLVKFEVFRSHGLGMGRVLSTLQKVAKSMQCEGNSSGLIFINQYSLISARRRVGFTPVSFGDSFFIN